MKDAVALLINKHRLPIVYQSKHLRRKRVTASCNNCSPGQALDLILKETSLTWEMVGSQFVLVQSRSYIRGRVRLKQTGEYLSGIEVTLFQMAPGAPSKFMGRVLSSPSGWYAFNELRAGHYTVRARAHGFESQTHEDIILQKDQTRELDLSIADVALPLQEIQVEPGAYTFLLDETRIQPISLTQLKRITNFGDDAMGVAENLPGIAGSDLSSNFHIRGGYEEEMVVVLDGMELDEPFHLKPVFSGLFSIVDAGLLGGLELMTGGVPVEYGNKMGGMIRMTSTLPTTGQVDVKLTSLGLNVGAQGVFHDQQGSYVLSFRDGYFGLFENDIVLTEFAESVSDINVDRELRFKDLFGKVSYKFNERHSVTADMLLARDKADVFQDGSFVVQDGFGTIDNRATNTQVWAQWESWWGSGLSQKTLVSSSRYERNTTGDDSIGVRQYLVEEDRKFNRAGFRQDWTYNWKDINVFTAGYEWKSADIDIRYRNNKRDNGRLYDDVNVGDVASLVKENSKQWGFYVSDKIRLFPELAVEMGLRYDRQSHTDSDQWSPRCHFIWSWRRDASLKFGWGRYHQPHALQEVQVGDGETFYYPEERAEHLTAGYQQKLRFGLQMRAEIYHKDLRPGRKRYLNYQDQYHNFPETQPDHIPFRPQEGKARGLELTLNQRINRSLGWVANYTRSEVYDWDENGVKVYRPWDQRDSANLAFDYAVQDVWSLSLSWHYHTGWRTTLIDVDVEQEDGNIISVKPVVGPLFEARYPPYHRLDLRYQRRFMTRKRHELALFVEVTNLYNRRNIQSIADISVSLRSDGQATLNLRDEIWIAQISNFGFTWRF